MSEQKTSVPRIAVAGLAILLVLYTLGIGPTFRWASKSDSRMEFYAKAYSPAIWVMRRSEAVHAVFHWYCMLWCDPPKLRPMSSHLPQL